MACVAVVGREERACDAVVVGVRMMACVDVATDAGRMACVGVVAVGVDQRAGAAVDTAAAAVCDAAVRRPPIVTSSAFETR